MQELHLVGYTSDLERLILAGSSDAGAEEFAVRLDSQLLEVIAEMLVEQLKQKRPQLTVPRELRNRPELRTARTDSALSPRDVQARLRAGRSEAEVAAEAGVDPEWVRRWAAPIAGERMQVVAWARALTFTDDRAGASAQPLGMAVRWNVADRGVRLTDDEFDACWSAAQVQGQVWNLAFSFVAGKRRSVARWQLNLHERELKALNRVASDLAHVEAGRRRPGPAPQPTPAEPPSPHLFSEVHPEVTAAGNTGVPSSAADTMSDSDDWNAKIIKEFRANDGRVGGQFEGMPLLLLHHTGAKSGTERVNPLVYRQDGDRLVVFASKAGAPTNPDWFHNLLAHPSTEVEVGTERKSVRARVADDDERERLWSLQKAEYPGFADYERKTSRQIPVVILEPAG